MSRFVLRGLVTLAVLLALYGGGLFVGKTSKAKQRGEDYSLDRLPRDMVVTLVDLVGSAVPEDAASVRGTTGDPLPDRGPEPTGSRPGSRVPSGPPPEIEKGRALFDAGDFRGALREWEFASRTHPSHTLEDDLANARLFAVVVERFPTAAERRREAVTTLMLRSGATVEGRVKEEDEKNVTLVFPGGSSGVIPKEAVADRIDPDPDRSREEREAEYQRLAGDIRSPFGRSYLDLAKWCVGSDLANHLAYLLERVRASESDEGPVIAELLLATYPAASSWDKEEIARVLDRCYPHHSGVRQLVRQRLGVRAAEPARPDDRPLAGAGEGPARTPRPPREGLTEEFLTRVDEARDYARQGKRHYEQAMPDMPDRAEHRRKAIELLEKARDLYDELTEERDEAWLRSRLQDVYQMLYWLKKDQPIR